jgi:hypothetical protein
MTTATSRQNLLASLAGLGIAVIGSCLLPATVHAAGFSGSFYPANWSIANVGGGAPDQTLFGSGSPPQYTCNPSQQVACAENIDAVSGAVDVVGSVSGQPGGETAGLSRTTTWTVTNGGQETVLSFDWALATFASGATNQSVSYLIGGTENFLSSSDGDSGSLYNISLAAGETFGFRVSTTDNTGDYGVLSISNFTATSVPGPLPLAGGIAAFRWSRRLRRRCRERQS